VIRLILVEVFRTLSLRSVEYGVRKFRVWERDQKEGRKNTRLNTIQYSQKTKATLIL